MASERIQLLIDVVTGNSKTALNQLKSDLNAADGAAGKLGVGAKAAGNFLKQNLALAATGAATAIAAFAVKAAGDFQDVALATGEFRDATGLAAEEASRFIELAGDLGIPVETLQTAFGRLNRAASDTPEAFDAIGAAIVRNRNGTVDVQETFLNTIDALNRIPDASQRASRAQEIFGRGWQEISELVGMGADQVRDALASVSSSKVINDDEVEKAREFRDQLDELKGVFEDITLAVGGGVVPVLSDLVGIVNGVGDAIGAIPAPPDWLVTSAKWLTPIGPIEAISNGISNLRGEFERTADVIPAAQSALAAEAAAAEDAEAANEELAAVIKAVTERHEDATEALEELRDQQLELISSTFDYEKASLALADQMANLTAKSRDGTVKRRELRQAEIAAAEAALAAAEAYANQSGAAEGSAASVALMKDELQRQADKYPALRDRIQRYIDKLEAIPSEAPTTVRLHTADAIAAANAFEDRLNRIADEDVTVRTSFINDQLVPGPRAHGGPVSAGVPYTVGEQGRELFVPNVSGSIVSHGATERALRNGAAPVNVTINGVDLTDTPKLRRVIRSVIRHELDG